MRIYTFEVRLCAVASVLAPDVDAAEAAVRRSADSAAFVKAAIDDVGFFDDDSPAEWVPPSGPAVYLLASGEPVTAEAFRAAVREACGIPRADPRQIAMPWG